VLRIVIYPYAGACRQTHRSSHRAAHTSRDWLRAVDCALRPGLPERDAQYDGPADDRSIRDDDLAVFVLSPRTVRCRSAVCQSSVAACSLVGMGLFLHHSRRADPLGVDRALASSDSRLRPRRERGGRAAEPSCILWRSARDTARCGTRVTRNDILARDPSPGSPVGTGV